MRLRKDVRTSHHTQLKEQIAEAKRKLGVEFDNDESGEADEPVESN